MSEETVRESQFSLKSAALRVFGLPVSCCCSLSQIKFSPVAKKLFVVTAVSTISVIFFAHHFKRRRGKKKGKVLPWEPEHLILEQTKQAASDKGSSCSSSRQNLTLSLSSTKDKGSQSCNYANGGLFSKYSGSAQSLASVQSVNSCHSCACGNSNSWDKADEDDIKLVNIPVTTPENLYLMGMELFEEALRRWEQALTFRSRQAEEEACGSVKLGAGDAIAEESVDDIISTEFIHKLEALLQRAYRLQEEFEATLGGSDPNSLGNDTGPLSTGIVSQAVMVDVRPPFQMDLLVLDQGHLLAKDLADQRAGLVDAGASSVEQRNPCKLALTTLSPEPLPRSRLSWGILGPRRWKGVLGGKLG